MKATLVRSLDAARRRGLLAVAAAALLFSGALAPVAAQAPGPDSVPRFDMDSVVVSIMVTPVRIGTSPYPISVAGRAELREGKSGMFLEDALRTLPGVQVQNRFNYAVGERVSVRGFGSRAQFGVRGIHVEVDGIPATLPDGQSTLDHVDIGSLGRVEALRGPASALYGNASGGVLRFQSQMPARTPVQEEATIVGGTDGLFRLQSVTGGTVGSTGYSVSLDKLNYDGFRKIQGGAGYGAADRFHLGARLEQSLGGGELGITLNHLNLDAENPGSIDIDSLRANPTAIRVPTYIANQTGKEVQQSQLGVTWVGMLSSLDVEASAYGLTRDFHNPLPGDVVDVDRRAGGARLTLGGSTTSGNVGLEIRGGADTDFMNDDRREFGNSGGKPTDLRLNQTERVQGIGAFVQASLSFSERVSLMGALRYDKTDFEVDDLFPVDSANPDDSGKRDMSEFSPTVGVHVQALPELGIFANYAESFETPTTVELGNREGGAGGFNPDLEAMTGKTYEVGVRGSVRQVVTYEASYYHTRLENELIAFEIASAPGLTYYRNAGSSDRDGAEVVLRVQAHELVSLQGTYNWVDAKFDSYKDEAEGYDYSGNTVPGLAPTQVQGSVRVGPSAWFVEGGIEHTTEMEVNDANSGVPTDAYTLFDVRVGGSGLMLGQLELSPFAGVQNLTDETYVSSVAINAFGGRFYEPGPGRTFFVGATLAVSR